MFLVYLGLYTLFLVVVWGFFIVTKIHAYKFKNFSNYITKVISFLFLLMVGLSILGYVIIFLYNPGNTSYKIDLGDKTVKNIEY